MNDGQAWRSAVDEQRWRDAVVGDFKNVQKRLGQLYLLIALQAVAITLLGLTQVLRR